jgi:hypothetical protein
MACHQLLSGFLLNGHLPRVSRQSRLSANDNGDNEMMGLCTDLLAFKLYCIVLYCIVLYCIGGVSLLPKALRPFQDLLCSP